MLGNIKENFGFRQFYLRELENVRTEMNIVCIAHNLKKIYTIKMEKEEKLRMHKKDLCNFNKKLSFIENYLILILNYETASAVQRPEGISPKMQCGKRD